MGPPVVMHEPTPVRASAAAPTGRSVPGTDPFQRLTPTSDARTQPAAPAPTLLELDSLPPPRGEDVEGSALHLVSLSRAGDAPADAAPDALGDMRDRYALGDFSGALVVADGVLLSDPSHGEAARCAQTCRERLYEMYAARLGPLARVPRVIVPPEQVRWLSLDHRAGFLLSCVDGRSSFEEILDVAGMPLLDALRILYEFHTQRIIAVDRP